MELAIKPAQCLAPTSKSGMCEVSLQMLTWTVLIRENIVPV